MFVANPSDFEKRGESIVKLISYAKEVYNVDAENSMLIMTKVEEIHKKRYVELKKF